MAKKQAKAERIRKQREARAQNHAVESQNDMAFQFPDFDYESDNDRDGIPMFTGTAEHLRVENYKLGEMEALGNIELSDDEAYENSLDISMGTDLNSSNETTELRGEESVMDESIVPTSRNDDVVGTSVSVTELVDNPDDDDQPPEAQSIVKVCEQVQDFQEPEPTGVKVPEKKLKKAASSKSYIEILRRPKRDPTLLEKLLESEINRERSQILQCLRYVCKQNFFGIGSDSTSAK